jgi:LmbE family N-acetylglucosaminyl deacetylase
MLELLPGADSTKALRLLCIGAHSDDLEIGCAGTLLTWLNGPRPLHITWVVLSASGERAIEARRSARILLKRAASLDIVVGEFRDGHLPADFAAAKAFFETIKGRAQPDVIFTHRIEDRHQDHRTAGELTWNTFRSHLILEFEILKYEGDLGLPNVYVPLAAAVARRKATHLERYFGSQRDKHWFSGENILSLARLRALECRAPGGFAEAFFARKLVLGVGGGRR